MAQYSIESGPGRRERGPIIGVRVVGVMPDQLQQVEVGKAVFSPDSNKVVRLREMRALAMQKSTEMPRGKFWVETITPRSDSMVGRNMEIGLAPSGLPLNHKRSD